MRISRKKNIYYRSALGIILLLLAACAVLHPPQYDAQTVDTLKILQSQTDAMFTSIASNLNTPNAAYKNYASQYQTLLTQLNSLIARNQAMSNNHDTVEQLNLLVSSIQDLQKRHELGFKTKVELNNLQSLIDNQFSSILTLETAKPHNN